MGQDRVACSSEAQSAYEQNVTDVRRKVAAVLYPVSTEEVVQVVRIANEFLVPLYPLGRGLNWGIGSRLPARDHGVIVDLSRMDRILEVSVTGQYAVVEPGVSQRQLADHLRKHDLPLVFNVNGSGAETSVVGNALERGIGYFSSRAESLSGLEIVLGTGEILRTGFGHYPDCVTTHVYRHGHGPFLDGLFSQGNFGIVTRAGVDLMPRHDVYRAALLRVADENDFLPMVEAITYLRSRDILQGVVHIGNWHRSECVVGPLARNYLEQRGVRGPWEESIAAFMRAEGYGAWSAIIGLSGTRSLVRAQQAEIRKAMPSCVRCAFVDEARLRILKLLCDALPFVPALQRKRALLPAITELHGLSMGRPTDETLKSVYWAAGQEVPSEPGANPDASHSGMIYVLPMLPMEAGVAREVVTLATQCFSKQGFRPYITINLIDRKIMEAVINVSFDRSSRERSDAAHTVVRDLDHSLRRRGWYPYRLRVGQMEDFVTEEDPYWQTVRRLKDVFDPNHVIAPGRYNLV